MASITTKQEEQHVTDFSYKESSSKTCTNSTVLCSKCNKPAQPNRTLRKCKCKGVQYCNNTCYRAHWKEHKAEHNRLVVKLLPSTGETKEDSATKVKEVATKDKPTIQKKKWIDNIEDNCPICLDDLSLDQTDTSRMTCCGKGMHLKCADQFDNSTSMSYEQKARCVMCRAQLPNSVKESIKQIRKWATKGKAWAQTMMGGRYEEGDGVRKSNCKAAEFYKLSAAQNDANGMENFARMSYHGYGVRQDFGIAFQLFQKAAKKGMEDSQYCLGCMYKDGDGTEQSNEKAREWWIAAGAKGNKAAINNLKQLDKDENQDEGFWKIGMKEFYIGRHKEKCKVQEK